MVPLAKLEFSAAAFVVPLAKLEFSAAAFVVALDLLELDEAEADCVIEAELCPPACCILLLLEEKLFEELFVSEASSVNVEASVVE